MALGFLLVCLAGLLWGTQGGVLKTFTDTAGADPIPTAFLASAIGASVLLAGGIAMGRAWPRPGKALETAFTAGGAVAAFIATYFAAIDMVGVAVAALVAVCSAPLFTTVLATLFLRERITPGATVGVAAGVAGTALLFMGNADFGTSAGRRGLLGLLLALTAGLALASRIVLVRRLVERIHPLQLAGLSWFGAAVLLAVLALGLGERFGSVGSAWPWLLYLGLVSMALAPLLQVSGLRRTPSVAAGILGLVEPLTATVVGVVAFDERLTFGTWVGGALILLAIVVLSVTTGRESAGAVADGALRRRTHA